ncbi:hypothetical protein AVEN_140747-1 [Araneus ventricosus]|uniref:Uncharacterized protein n=1 Tax=Araneus ventricosus TaxID=182803 RepID=A0A4Y2F4V2_ARAVE|nr:hypothetical protein AVEN_140747-1 [Araneus ventricosus]
MGRSVAGCKIMLYIPPWKCFSGKGLLFPLLMLVENLKKKSLINQRRAYDGIESRGRVENVSITKRMLLDVRGAKHRYRADLVRKKEYLDKKKSIKDTRKEKIRN